MALDHEAEEREPERDHDRDPGAFGELLEDRDDEDQDAEDRGEQRGSETLRPHSRMRASGASIQNRTIPTFESENVRNTLIAYMTTSCETDPSGEAEREARGDGPSAARRCAS